MRVRAIVAALAVLFLLCNAASAAFTIVQTATSGTTNKTGTAPTQAFAATVTSGNAVVGTVTWDSSAGTPQTITSITDDKSNTYNVKSITRATADGVSLAEFELGNITNAPITLTIHYSASVTFSSIIIAEVSGVKAVSDPIDGTVGQVQTNLASGTNNQTSGNITTTVNADFILAAGADVQKATAPTTGTNVAWTSINTATVSLGTIGTRLEWFPQVTAGAIAGVFSNTDNGTNTITVVLALQPAAGGGATCQSLALLGVGC